MFVIYCMLSSKIMVSLGVCINCVLPPTYAKNQRSTTCAFVFIWDKMSKTINATFIFIYIYLWCWLVSFPPLNFDPSHFEWQVYGFLVKFYAIQIHINANANANGMPLLLALVCTVLLLFTSMPWLKRNGNDFMWLFWRCMLIRCV